MNPCPFSVTCAAKNATLHGEVAEMNLVAEMSNALCGRQRRLRGKNTRLRARVTFARQTQPRKGGLEEFLHTRRVEVARSETAAMICAAVSQRTHRREKRQAHHDSTRRALHPRFVDDVAVVPSLANPRCTRVEVHLPLDEVHEPLVVPVGIGQHLHRLRKHIDVDKQVIFLGRHLADCRRVGWNDRGLGARAQRFHRRDDGELADGHVRVVGWNEDPERAAFLRLGQNSRVGRARDGL